MLNKTLMLLKSKYNIYNKRVVSLLLVFFMLLAFVPITAKAATTITVTYNANGGSGAPSAVNVTANSLFYISSTKPTRTGYTFQGWSKSSTATAVSYVSGSSVSFSANTTLYAVWKANTYTISYNANGGSGAPASQAKTYGITLTLSSTKPTRTGYTFQGWSTSSTATSATYSAGGSYTANASATLYAVWKADAVTMGGAVSFDALSMFMMCKFPQGYNCRVFAFGSNEISVLNDSTKARKLSGINDSVASNEYRIALVDQSGSHAMRQTTNGWAEVSGNNTNDPHPCDTPSGNGYIYYAVKVVIHGNTPCSQCPNGTSCPKIQP